MPRNISFALTKEQIRNRTKDVTRRLGWTYLKPGDILNACEKVQGRKASEPIVCMGQIKVVSVRREPLWDMTAERFVAYGFDEVKREGFPHMTPAAFVLFFCDSHAKCTPQTIVTRIEFSYL